MSFVRKDEFKPVLDSLFDMVTNHLNKVDDPRPELRMDESRKSSLIDSIADSIYDLNNGDDLRKDLVFDPNFLDRLRLTIATTLTLEQDEQNNEEDFGESLLKVLELDDLSKENVEKLIADLKALQELIDEKLKDKDPTNTPKGKIEEFIGKLSQNLKIAGIQLKPEAPQKDMEDNLLDITRRALGKRYSNLFGVETLGGHLIPMPAYLGNGLAFADWNPNDGLANIDSQNSIQDLRHGDPQGLNARTEQLLDGLGDPLTKEATMTCFHNHGIEPLTPRPGMPGNVH